ncbi:aldehyde dehydrogenase (NADP(+)) [Arthrobacter sp. GCM10027362]|uniref:aldehyde dehydrogenase (NADP(+)) n=1 Tax=Arthrobacter sp. GCM10027362 TaxID=3273379 RepID=UPI00362835F1
MTAIAGTNPYTGERLEPVADESTRADVNAAVEAAAAASGYLRAIDRPGRAGLLRAIADNLEANGEEFVGVADQETGIGPERLTGELKRAVFQLRFFADVIEEGSYVEAAIDTPADTPMGPRPDLRRMLVPLGPVAVFGASNFPFAFSVAGGDTASALAAGCPVVVKAHGSHPKTSRLAFEFMNTAAKDFGAPDGVIGIVYGLQAGIDLVSHPKISAVGFTGSLSGGKALMEAIGQRDTPIPFYGELSSLNPLVVSASAARERADEIGAGLAASVTMAAGQLCTKPGIIFIPAGGDGDRLVSTFAQKLSGTSVSPLLNRRIYESYGEILAALQSAPGVKRVAAGPEPSEAGFRVAPTLYSVDAPDLRPGTAHECFGPSALIVRYGGYPELEAALAHIDDGLTLSLHVGADEPQVTQELTEMALPKAGRIIYNGYPTGVAVSWAQTHGGPWPATNSLHTSVGATAIRRFLRPVTWQNAPESVLPPELRDGDRLVPTRVDGRLTLPVNYLRAGPDEGQENEQD